MAGCENLVATEAKRKHWAEIHPEKNIQHRHFYLLESKSQKKIICRMLPEHQIYIFIPVYKSLEIF